MAPSQQAIETKWGIWLLSSCCLRPHSQAHKYQCDGLPFLSNCKPSFLTTQPGEWLDLTEGDTQKQEITVRRNGLHTKLLLSQPKSTLEQLHSCREETWASSVSCATVHWSRSILSGWCCVFVTQVAPPHWVHGRHSHPQQLASRETQRTERSHFSTMAASSGMPIVI